jgi:hypothetical protein
MAGQTVNVRPSILNLLLYAGDGFSVGLSCKNTAGAPIDLTGAVIAQIRLDRLHPDDPPLALFSVNMVDAFQGNVTLVLSGEQTKSLLTPGEPEFNGVWDVQWNGVGKEPFTLVQGTVECVADVTR